MILEEEQLTIHRLYPPNAILGRRLPDSAQHPPPLHQPKMTPPPPNPTHLSLRILSAGKSLTVHEVARQCWAASLSRERERPTVVSINCMTLKQPNAIFGRALAGFGGCGRGASCVGSGIVYPGRMQVCLNAFAACK